ncbi:RNA-binding S4 domain-containing protein [Cyanothece sp. BG0011]|uniref:RNA-binding S4 domain-containing protein n=1 Tax=Cyanothece sp. BG0011 TaxID=2082950 RepID=UPI000D1EE6FC|nr:RNA-binding S4 domain-containing protein [Cyanothece sp. BG0011]
MTNTDKKSSNMIRLGQFMKWQNLVQSGGEAKIRIQGGEVMVNGCIETRRGRQLTSGDRVTFNGQNYEVNL